MYARSQDSHFGTFAAMLLLTGATWLLAATGCAWISEAEHARWLPDVPTTTTDSLPTSDSADTGDTPPADTADTSDTAPPVDTGPFDRDEDGVPDKDDCAPDDPDISPDHDEVPCNGIDDDCSDKTDDGQPVALGDGDLAAALADFVSGDTLCLEAGSWTGPLDYGGRDLVVASQDGPDATTVELHGAAGPAVIVRGGEKDARLIGFTVRNAVGGEGSALAVSGSTFSAQDVTFADFSEDTCNSDYCCAVRGCVGQLFDLDDATVDLGGVWLRDSTLIRSDEYSIASASVIDVRGGSTVSWSGGGVEDLNVSEYAYGSGKDIVITESVVAVREGSELTAADLVLRGITLEVEAASSLEGAATVTGVSVEDAQVSLTRVEVDNWQLLARAGGTAWRSDATCRGVHVSTDGELTWTDSTAHDLVCSAPLAASDYTSTAIGLHVTSGSLVLDGLVASEWSLSSADTSYALSLSQASGSLSHLDLRDSALDARDPAATGQRAALARFNDSAAALDHVVLAANEVTADDTVRGLIVLDGGAVVTLEHGTLTRNAVAGEETTGAVLLVDEASRLDLVHTTVDNHTVGSNASSAFAWVETLDDLTVSWSNVAANTGVTEWVLASDGTSRVAADGEGNQAEDPAYVEADGPFPLDWDLTPAAGSVLEDNGEETCTDASDGSRCDIGAYGGQASWVIDTP